MRKLLLILLCLPLLFSSCSKPEGCVEGNCIDGLGTFIVTEDILQSQVVLYNEAIYKGKLGTYVGEFKDGLFHGQGIFTYDLSSRILLAGAEYIGEWKDGKENGEGTFRNNEGTYVGEFKDGEFCGKGTFTYYDGQDKEEESGNWKDGELNGYGTRIWSKHPDNTHQGKYIGNFKAGWPNGSGAEWYNSGDYFKGNFDCCSERKPMQEGTMYYLDGTSEYGAWETIRKYTYE